VDGTYGCAYTITWWVPGDNAPGQCSGNGFPVGAPSPENTCPPGTGCIVSTIYSAEGICE
jgi:hypothetical protein